MSANKRRLVAVSIAALIVAVAPAKAQQAGSNLARAVVVEGTLDLERPAEVFLVFGVIRAPTTGVPTPPPQPCERPPCPPGPPGQVLPVEENLFAFLDIAVDPLTHIRAEGVIQGTYPADPILERSVEFTTQVTEGPCAGGSVPVSIGLTASGDPQTAQSLDRTFEVGGTTFNVSGEAQALRSFEVTGGAIGSCIGSWNWAKGSGFALDGSSAALDVGGSPGDGAGTDKPPGELDLAAQGPESVVTNDGSVVDVDLSSAMRSDFVRSYDGSGIVGTAGDAAGPAGAKPMPEYAAESIIGSDGRARVFTTTSFPARATGNMVMTFPRGNFGCTGWLISPDTVATAGHCVYDDVGNDWATSITFTPGQRDATTQPYGSCNAIRLYSVDGWVDDEDERYDYGAFKLNCTVGWSTGWYGFFWRSWSLTGLPVAIRGYPGDKPAGEQWASWDSVRVTHSRQVFYRADTVGGMSGSPVYYWRNGCGPCAMTFHTNGTHGSSPHGTNNHGTRITEARFNNLVAWIED